MNENIVNTSAGSPANLIKYFSSVNNNNNNHSNGSSDNNNNNPINVNLNSSKKQANSNNSSSNSGESCCRCGQRVYQVEQVGPVNQVIFHKSCFKCVKCGQNLTLKNYFTNPLDASDKQLYCVKDCPKVPLGGIDARAFGIRAALMAPSAKMNAHSDVIRWFGNVPKIGADAMHIREALLAQSELQRKNLLDNKHNFPFWIQTKEKLLECQRELEREQKKDEDKLVESFQEERLQVVQVVDQEINQEWEENLRRITADFERQNRRKESISYSRKIDELSKTMSMKKKTKMEAMTVKLQTTARAKTADLVKLQSEQMLSLLKKKQEELKMELRKSGEMGDMSVMSFPAEIPAAHAPRIRKRDLYHDASVFNDLDEYVFQVAETEHNTYTELVAQLTANCFSDLEKARAIFRWITVKDLNVMTFSDSIKQDTPLGLLRGIKFGTESYHTLFMRLCSYAGLTCREVKGHSKSVGYEPGMKIHSGNFTNTWNVVLIGSDWWPVQSNWGARHLVMNKDQTTQQYQNQTVVRKSRDKIRYEYDEHYFLTDPDEFSMEFLAEDEEWQLLETPMNLSKFESLPFVRSVFFHNGLEFSESSRKAEIVADTNGGAEVQINLSPDAGNLTVFHYHLRFADKNRRRDTHFQGIDMERYVFHTITDQNALFSVHVPMPADYYLEIFTNKFNEARELKDSNTDFKPFKLKCAAKFIIKCPKIEGKLYPLPNCAPGEWGPLKATRYFGIQAINHKVGVINVVDEVTIKFQLPKLMKMLVKLYFNGVERRELDKFFTVEIGNDKVIKICIKFPQKGQFGMDMYGQCDDVETEANSLAHVCKYLINVTDVSNPVSLPKIASKNVQRNASIASTLVPVQLFELSYEGYDQTTDRGFVQSNGQAVENIYNEPKEPLLPANGHASLRTMGSIQSQPLPSPPGVQRSASALQPNSLASLPLGQNTLFSAFGLKTTSHKSARIEKFEKNGAFATEFSKPTEVKLSAKLSSTLGEDFSHLIMAKDAGKKCKFKVNLPGHGCYYMVVKASNQNGQGQNMVDVYNYELNYRDPKSKTGSMKKK